MNTANESRWCIACAFEQKHTAMFVKDGVPIYRCNTCGLGSADAQNFDPTAYYDAKYFNGSRHDGYADYQASESVLRLEFRKTLEALRKIGAKGGTLLELGCAYGFFLSEAKLHFDVHGMEICEDAVAACNSRGLTSVVKGMASAEELRTMPSADVVVMLDVIEHLETPGEILKNLSSKLLPGGVMLLTTGDFSSTLSKLFGKHWRLMTPPQHLWFFTPTALRKMAEHAGLDFVSVEYPSKRVPLSLIFYQLARLAHVHLTPPKALNRIGIPINTFDAMRVTLRKPA